MNEKTLILTPNRRMAAFLKKGSLPLSLWLEHLYSELSTVSKLPVRLTKNEQRVVWEKVVRASRVGQSLLKISGTARLAYEAWLLSHQWRVVELDAAWQTQDTRAYQEWASEYRALCCDQNWVDSATFVDVLIEAIKRKEISLPHKINVVGFEEFSPQLLEFFQAIREVGSEVTIVSNNTTKGSLSCLPAIDSDQELQLAATMAKNWLDREPGALIGIVIPTLEQQRQKVVSIFNEHLTNTIFNVSAPIPLMDYPFIQSIFLVLDLLKDPIGIEDLSRFLRSPFWGNIQSEQVLRAQLDLSLRQFGVEEFSAKNLLGRLSFLNKDARFSTVDWLITLKDFFQKDSVFWKKQSTLQWKEWFVKKIAVMGWPGERKLTLDETQLKQQWDALLTEYVSMEKVLGEHHYSEAVFQLQSLAKETFFLPASSKASVQVLGVLEAAGLSFDYLWVSGFNRESWPMPPKPNPFIPLSLQRTGKLPRSSAARELEIALKLTKRLSQSAKQVIFSYPEMYEERNSVKSPLLAGIPEVTSESLGLGEVCSVLARLSKIDPVPYNPQMCGPTLRTDERVMGGTRVLALQSLCPFWAFSEIRLKAIPMRSHQIGLNPLERGEIIHQVLAAFWCDIPDQMALKTFNEKILVQRIEKSIEKTLLIWADRKPDVLKTHYLRLEKERIFRLVHRFLALEKTRPFFKILSQEQKRIVTLGGITFTVRLDRIDQLDDGGIVIIDYKTGKVSMSDWFGERPKDLQLPFYCVTYEQEPVGMLFGILHPEGVHFQGLVKDQEQWLGMKGIKSAHTASDVSSWEEQQMVWRSTLGLLASEFSQGVARVEPLEGEKTCRLCSLKALCRVHSRQQVENCDV